MIDTRFDHVTVRNSWANAETVQVNGCGKIDKDSPDLLRDFCDCQTCALSQDKKGCLAQRREEGLTKKTVKIESLLKYSF